MVGDKCQWQLAGQRTTLEGWGDLLSAAEIVLISRYAHWYCRRSLIAGHVGDKRQRMVAWRNSRRALFSTTRQLM